MLERISARTQILGAVIIGALLIFGVSKYYTLRIAPDPEMQVEAEQPTAQQSAVPKLVTVHVVGAVAQPGVYSLEEGKRINDVVSLAEPTEKADLSLINLAAPLQDGKQIYVPAKGEKGAKARSLGSSFEQGQGKININAASAGELDKLSGIGPALAQRIIAYRESHGPFATIEDITKVNGIGAALLEKIKADITVD